jgi:hypothetical protein
MYLPENKLIVSGNTMIRNDPVLLNDGSPNDGSIVGVYDFFGPTIWFTSNLVIGSTPAALIYCEPVDVPAKLIGNVLINFSGTRTSEFCSRSPDLP